MATDWETRVEQVRALILDAFASVPLPPAEDLLVGPRPAESTWPPAWLVEEARDTLRLPWEQVAPRRYQHANHAVHLLPLAGQCYHLPGQMLAGLRGFPVSLFMPEMPAAAEQGHDPGCDAMLARLTPAQRQAVGEFLALCLAAAQAPRTVASLSNRFFRAHSDPIMGVLRCAALSLAYGWRGCGHPAVQEARELVAQWPDGSGPAKPPSDVRAATPRLHEAGPLSPEQVALLGQIRAAFADVPVPTATNPFAPLPEFDEEGAADLRCPVRLDHWRKEFADRRWDEVAHTAYADPRFFFSWLRPDVWRYHLPGLLAAMVRGDVMVGWLGPFGYYVDRLGADPLFERSKAGLTTAQRQVVCSVLALFIRGLPDADTVDPELVVKLDYGDWQAMQVLKRGWHDVDHEAVRRTLGWYHRWCHFHWPRSQDSSVRPVLAQIREAFDDTPYPPDGILCEMNGYSPEPLEYQMELRGADWRTLHPEMMSNCGPALCFLGPAGFRYFLPAYLTANLMGAGGGGEWELTHGFHEQDAADDRLQFDATSPQIDWRAHSEAKCALFNTAERRAIVAYLRYTAETDEDSRGHIEQALESYWLPSIAALERADMAGSG